MIATDVGYQLASSEYGKVAHRVRSGIIFQGAASAACGHFARQWVPAERPERLCARCFPALGRERVT